MRRLVVNVEEAATRRALESQRGSWRGEDGRGSSVASRRVSAGERCVNRVSVGSLVPAWSICGGSRGARVGGGHAVGGHHRGGCARTTRDSSRMSRRVRLTLLGLGGSRRSRRVVAVEAVAVRASGGARRWWASQSWLRANTEDSIAHVQESVRDSPCWVVAGRDGRDGSWLWRQSRCARRGEHALGGHRRVGCARTTRESSRASASARDSPCGVVAGRGGRGWSWLWWLWRCPRRGEHAVVGCLTYPASRSHSRCLLCPSCAGTAKTKTSSTRLCAR